MKEIIKENQLIESILNQYKTELNKDIDSYKNHVYRVFNYALVLDSETENTEKYAITAAFHDLGIWTHSFDYLEHSIALATEYLIENNQQNWVEEVSLMIDNHHRRSSYRGEFNEIVNVFRKSDWID